MKKIIIVGAGGFAREVYDWYNDTNQSKERPIIGFLSKNTDDFHNFNMHLPILGDPETYAPQEDEQFIMAIGDVSNKRRIALALKEKGVQFLTLIHPSAIVSPFAQIHEGVVLTPYTVVGAHSIIYEFAMLNVHSYCGHDAKIGAFSILSPYATVNGFVTLEEGVFMGTHAHVAPKLRIGRNAVISAHASVRKNMPEASKARPAFTEIIS